MKEKTFSKWDLDDVENTFSLKLIPAANSITLQNWIQSPLKIEDPFLLKILENKRILLLDNAISWNEEELKMYFITYVMDAVHFRGDSFRLFYERKLSALLQDIDGKDVKIGGNVEAVVAKGHMKPMTPYFFMQEYKAKGGKDPNAQLLLAMLCGRKLNGWEPSRPLYGLTIFETDWNFVVLEGKEYSISPNFEATEKDKLEQITGILLRLKEMIKEWAGETLPLKK